MVNLKTKDAGQLQYHNQQDVFNAQERYVDVLF